MFWEMCLDKCRSAGRWLRSWWRKLQLVTLRRLWPNSSLSPLGKRLTRLHMASTRCRTCSSVRSRSSRLPSLTSASSWRWELNITFNVIFVCYFSFLNHWDLIWLCFVMFPLLGSWRLPSRGCWCEDRQAGRDGWGTNWNHRSLEDYWFVFLFLLATKNYCYVVEFLLERALCFIGDLFWTRFWWNYYSWFIMFWLFILSVSVLFHILAMLLQLRRKDDTRKSLFKSENVTGLDI